jgi:hypothetical protein
MFTTGRSPRPAANASANNSTSVPDGPRAIATSPGKVNNVLNRRLIELAHSFAAARQS